MNSDPQFLGFHNKFISFALVNLLSNLTLLSKVEISFPIISFIYQVKSFSELEHVAGFIFITPIILAISYYLLIYLYCNDNYSVLRDFLIMSILVLLLFTFLYLISNFQTNILDISIINDITKFSIFSTDYSYFGYGVFLLSSAYYCANKIKKIKAIFLILYFLLDGFLFLLAINSIYEARADGWDFYYSYLYLILLYLGTWVIVSIYVSKLHDKTKSVVNH
jgi:hypothetical protein